MRRASTDDAASAGDPLILRPVASWRVTVRPSGTRVNGARIRSSSARSTGNDGSRPVTPATPTRSELGDGGRPIGMDPEETIEPRTLDHLAHARLDAA